MMRTDTSCFVSQRARTNPVGPAPTIKTLVSTILLLLSVHSLHNNKLLRRSLPRRSAHMGFKGTIGEPLYREEAGFFSRWMSAVGQRLEHAPVAHHAGSRANALGDLALIVQELRSKL